MTREEAKSLVLDYVYGELPEDRRAEFESILQDDPELRTEVDSIRVVREATASLEPVHLPQEVRKSLMKAASRRIAEREALDSNILTLIERFFLSPSFAGSLVVLVALGVGIHLILETGLDDRIARLERGEKAAVHRNMPESEPGPSGPPLPDSPSLATGAVAEVVSKETAPRKLVSSVAAEAKLEGDKPALQPTVATPARKKGPATRGQGDASRRYATATATDRSAVSPKLRVKAGGKPDSSLGFIGTGSTGSSAKGGGDSAGYGRIAAKSRPAAARPEPSKAAPPTASGKWAEAPTADNNVTLGLVSAKVPSEGIARSKAGRDPPEDSRNGDSLAEERSVEQREEESLDGDRNLDMDTEKDKRGIRELDRARELRSGGDLEDALSSYLKALSRGLEGRELEDALYEAAEVALRLGRTDAARKLVDRLSRKAGNEERARKLLDQLGNQAK